MRRFWRDIEDYVFLGATIFAGAVGLLIAGAFVLALVLGPFAILGWSLVEIAKILKGI